MRTKNFATFTSTLPDDSIEEGDEIVSPGGRSVAESIAAEIRSRGGEAAVVAQHSFYGWEFSGSVDGFPFWCLLQAPGAWLLIVEDRRSFFRRWFTRPEAFHHVLSAFDSALQRLDHISEVEWLTSSEYTAMARKKGSERKTAQPGATDNPGDAQRLREDH
jgi:hypothetical protein